MLVAVFSVYSTYALFSAAGFEHGYILRVVLSHRPMKKHIYIDNVAFADAANRRELI